jgi:hypothetical protein
MSRNDDTAQQKLEQAHYDGACGGDCELCEEEHVAYYESGAYHDTTFDDFAEMRFALQFIGRRGA